MTYPNVIANINFKNPRVDIFTTIALLEQVLKEYQLNRTERQIIEELYQAITDPNHKRREGKEPGPEDLLALKNTNYLIRLKQKITHAFDQSSTEDLLQPKKSPFFRNAEAYEVIYEFKPSTLSLRDVLGCTLACMNGIQEILQKSHDPSFLYPEQYDFFYHQIVNKFNGTIVLPIRQCLDFRYAASDGVCFGYGEEWTYALLKNKRPFGINSTQPSAFKPIKLSSKTGALYPDINHLAPLTRDIAMSQMTGSYRDFRKRAVQTYLPLDPIQLAENLVRAASKDAEKIYVARLTNNFDGHDLRFKMSQDGSCHFLDANLGWIYFEKTDHFKQWLPFHYEKMGYRYEKYDISSISLNDKKPFAHYHLKNILLNVYQAYQLSIYVLAATANFIWDKIQNFLLGKSSPNSTVLFTDTIKPKFSKKSSPVVYAQDDLYLEKYKRKLEGDRSTYGRIAASLQRTQAIEIIPSKSLPSNKLLPATTLANMSSRFQAKERAHQTLSRDDSHMGTRIARNP